MKIGVKRYLSLIAGFTVILIASAFAFMSVGCIYQPQPVPIANIDKRTELTNRLGRIDMPAEELELGLGRAFGRLASLVGDIDYQPLVKDYVLVIRKSLYDSGFCGIRKLNLNGTTVDMDISFRIDHSPPTLNIEVFIDGETQPTFTLVNRYLVTTQ